jgi:hypothetical protein
MEALRDNGVGSGVCEVCVVSGFMVGGIVSEGSARLGLLEQATITIQRQKNKNTK